MSHPKEEVGVEAEVAEAEVEEEEEVLPQENRFQGVGRGQFTFRGNWQPRESNYRGRGGGQKFDKSPNVKKARVNTKTP